MDQALAVLPLSSGPLPNPGLAAGPLVALLTPLAVLTEPQTVSGVSPPIGNSELASGENAFLATG